MDFQLKEIIYGFYTKIFFLITQFKNIEKSNKHINVYLK